MNIRAGDNVVVITGKDKGKTGQVLRVLHEKNRVVVTDINIRTRHMKATPNRPGEIVKYEASLSASNVMLVDPKTKKRSRLGFKKENGKKTRIFKQSGDEVKKTAIAKKKDVKAADKAADKAVEKASAKTEAKKKDTKEAPKSQDPKSPFWKKMGFGAEEMGGAGEVEGTSHMKEDHSVPDQSSGGSRSSQRGS
ncbi:MAG: 50S ribosomal protein L24 [Candidatus Peribacter sp.]|jgi:large subunit ribosomal protein L24|nr:50S ribosomal protein L24 [Candidatus Peribacter sp.]MBT4392520.1 50S ribosomal protein L24 [Candidatus Peribacter sp.]MBT4601399.1 50S ribosomal protein L24 [Candidatus Peribacter sp.]MBT5149537.1 50S ribosomal protein L24 [Candidatus Peribacter sp.]MBT5638089.1 50S ribosomal protein L24 [Candidatus Peribacter sp.]